MHILVSISLSSGFSFQGSLRWRHHRICRHVSISLSSGFSFQVLFAGEGQSSLQIVSISLSSGFSFQVCEKKVKKRVFSCVSISLSSGFSFQVQNAIALMLTPFCFNLVIERLLISGAGLRARVQLFSHKFQSRYRAASHFRQGIRAELDAGLPTFQSRYRAASHFRFRKKVKIGVTEMSFNLVIERLLISGVR